jgi:hypothetical protein
MLISSLQIANLKYGWSMKAETLNICSEFYASQRQVFHSIGIFFCLSK